MYKARAQRARSQMRCLYISMYMVRARVRYADHSDGTCRDSPSASSTITSCCVPASTVIAKSAVGGFWRRSTRKPRLTPQRTPPSKTYGSNHLRRFAGFAGLFPYTLRTRARVYIPVHVQIAHRTGLEITPHAPANPANAK